jgi:predicted metal-dependent hydrolase
MNATVPPALHKFVELFNASEFWESHEVLEVPWRENRSNFYKGLILFASTFVHLQRGNAKGVRAQVRKTQRHLEPYAPGYMGIDVAGVLAAAARILSAVGSEGADARLDSMLPPPPLVINPALVRGDEVEGK